MPFPNVIVLEFDGICLFGTARRAFHLRVRAVPIPSQRDQSNVPNGFTHVLFLEAFAFHTEPHQYEAGGDKGGAGSSVEAPS